MKFFRKGTRRRRRRGGLAGCRAAADAEQNEWQNLLSSKEWQSTDRHFAICEQKVAAIFEKTLSN
jgi:hypothetical protein